MSRFFGLAIALLLVIAGPAGARGKDPADHKEWRKAVGEILKAHTSYPKAAQATAPKYVLLLLVVSRDGTIKKVSLKRASGDAAFDAAAMEMVKKARRFPPFPANMTGVVRSFVLPVRYSSCCSCAAGANLLRTRPPACEGAFPSRSE